MPALQPLIIVGITGRNGTDPPELLADDQCADAKNVEFIQRGLARKRDGMLKLPFVFAIPRITGVVNSLLTHTPTAKIDDAQLWAAGTKEGGSVHTLERFNFFAWGEPTIDDPLLTSMFVEGASLAGKLFLAYKSAVDRLHVYDGTVVRRVGISVHPSSPAVTDTGTGTYPAKLRHYRAAFIEMSGGFVLRRSELSVAASFTPSGTGAAARVQPPPPTADRQTHWELYGDEDGTGTYVLLATVPLTPLPNHYDDTADPATYTGQPAPPVGANTPPTSWRYIRADDNRLIGAGSWEPTGYSSRVWFTPVLGSGNGSTATGDLERVPDTTDLKYYIDCDEHEGGGITGLSPVMEGAIYVFKHARIYRLVATGDVNAPYQRITISKSVGCPWHRSIVLAEDENGAPCLYFLSADGPYRLGSGGLQYMGHDIEDLWTVINVDSSIGETTPAPHGQYVRHKKQVRWWASGSAPQSMNSGLVFDVRYGRPSLFGVTGGWTQWTLEGAAASGYLRGAACSTLFGSISQSSARLVRCYISTNDAATILEQDADTDSDNDVLYRASVVTKAYAPAGLNHIHSVGQATIFATVPEAVTIELQVLKNFGIESRAFTVTLAPDTGSYGPVNRVIADFEDSATQDAAVLQFALSDIPYVVGGRWAIDALIVPVADQGER